MNAHDGKRGPALQQHQVSWKPGGREMRQPCVPSSSLFSPSIPPLSFKEDGHGHPWRHTHQSAFRTLPIDPVYGRKYGSPLKVPEKARMMPSHHPGVLVGAGHYSLPAEEKQQGEGADAVQEPNSGISDCERWK